jgi:hypothetical protein
MLRLMSEAAERRHRRQLEWSSKLFRGPCSLEALEGDALDEWAAMDPRERLALTWELSLAQHGEVDESAMESRLPRSAYRLQRR